MVTSFLLFLIYLLKPLFIGTRRYLLKSI